MTELAQRKPPFFIVGSGRSGTTLLQALINGHPSIAIPPDSHLYDRISPVIDTYGDFALRANRERFVADLLDDAYIRRWHLHATPKQLASKAASADRTGLVDALFTSYAEQRGATRWGDRTPDHIRCLEAVRADFPDAKLIHLVRDGRDRAVLRRRMIWGPSTAYGIAHEWRDEMLMWSAFCKRHGTTNTLVVRYEDLVSTPRQIMQRIFAFLEETYVDTVALFAETPTTRPMSIAQSQSQLQLQSSLAQEISTKKIGVYRRTLTRREVEIFEAVARDQLIAYGYLPEFSTPRPATMLERGASSIKDHALHWYRKLQHPYAAWRDVEFRVKLVHRHLAGYLGTRRVA